MPEESEDEIRTPAEARKATIDLSAEVADADGRGIAEVLFDVTMTPLLGIQIRGIGRKPVHLDLRVCAKIPLDHRGPMRTEPVPDQDEGARNIALEVAEGGHNVIPTDGMFEVPLVDTARQREPDGRREGPTHTDTPQDRGLPNWRPGRACLGAE
jgi:hypothetical protein